MPKPGLAYDFAAKTWGYNLERKVARGYKTKLECAKAYAKAAAESDPRCKELLTGKKWPDVFRLLGIEIEREIA